MKGKIIPVPNMVFEVKVEPNVYFQVEKIFCEKCNTFQLVYPVTGHWWCNVCGSLLGFPVTTKMIPARWTKDAKAYETLPYMLQGDTEVYID